MKKYKVCGPVQDGQFTCWHVLGPRNGFIAEFLTKKAAQEYIKQCKGRKALRAERWAIAKGNGYARA
jgi:hypothetical protein